MNKMSISFVMGRGNVEHNMRRTKGNGLRQNGVAERRFLNEYGVTDGECVKETADATMFDAEAVVKEIVRKEVGDALAALNEKNIAGRHPERVKTLEQWIDANAYVRGGNKKHLLSEYVLQVGNKFSGIPWIPERDSDGNMLTRSGMVIPEWDTRRVPAYKDNKIVESKISKKLKAVYKEFVHEFEKRNPNATVICYAIHGDEGGGLHAHLTVLWKNRCNKGVGMAIACPTASMRQQYEAQGIKCGNTKKNNAMNMWRKDMRALLEDVCSKNGIDRLDMHNKEKHRSVSEFMKFKDKHCEALETKEDEIKMNGLMLEEKQEMLKEKEAKLKEKEKELKEKEIALKNKELALASDIAKQEWYILKTKHKELYKKIHDEYLKNKKMLQNVLDR